jgi:hypothetical protein
VSLCETDAFRSTSSGSAGQKAAWLVIKGMLRCAQDDKNGGQHEKRNSDSQDKNNVLSVTGK